MRGWRRLWKAPYTVFTDRWDTLKRRFPTDCVPSCQKRTLLNFNWLVSHLIVSRTVFLNQNRNDIFNYKLTVCLMFLLKWFYENFCINSSIKKPAHLHTFLIIRFLSEVSNILLNWYTLFQFFPDTFNFRWVEVYAALLKLLGGRYRWILTLVDIRFSCDPNIVL